MLPSLSGAELQIVAALMVVVVLARVAGNETRTWLMCLTAAVLTPADSWEIVVVVGVISVLLRPVELIAKFRR